MLRLGTHELPSREIAAAITAPGQALYYLSAGSVLPVADRRARRSHTRVVMIPRLGLAELQAAQRSWCAVATLELGEPVPHIDVEALLRPAPGSRWAAIPAETRARLLTQAIELVEAHASELAAFDPRDLGIRTDAVALEHIFFGLVAHRASCEDLAVILLGSGGEDRWLLRLVFTETGRVWRRGVVLAPTGALAGVELAAVAGEVVAWVQDRRHAPRGSHAPVTADDVDGVGAGGTAAAVRVRAAVGADGAVGAVRAVGADEKLERLDGLAGLAGLDVVEAVAANDAVGAGDSPVSRALAPELEAALQAGASLLASRISSLVPPDTSPLLH